MIEDPAGLLSSLDHLRQRVRRDRGGFPLPLALFAVLVLVAPVFYWSDWDAGVLPERGRGPFALFESTDAFYGGNNTLIQWYWMLGLITCFAVSAWWYRRTARSTGVELDTRTYLLASGAALVGMVFGERLLRASIEIPLDTSLYSRPEINLPILVGATVMAVAAFAVGVRWKKLRVVSAFATALFAMVAFSAIAVYMVNGLGGLLIIAVAVLALAWAERSPMLAMIGVLFTVASLHANLAGLSYSTVGFFAPSQLRTLVDVAPPAAVLILGCVIAFAGPRRTTR